MHIVLTDPDGSAVAIEQDFDLKIQWGDDDGGNDFELSGVRAALAGGSMVYIDGTEIGGVVDEVHPVRTIDGESVSYCGRSWHGVLAGHVLCPPAGSSHVEVSGDANAALSRLMSLCGVGEPFAASPSPSGLTVPGTRLPRFCTLYDAMRRVCRAAGGRLSIVATQRGVEVSAVPSVEHGGLSENGAIPFSATRSLNRVNHIVALGKGEMQDREVVHLYADADGNVSDTQSIFGLNERAVVYELSNEEGEGLRGKAADRLAELQSADKVEVDMAHGDGVSVGDTVHAYSPPFGVSVISEVIGMVVDVENGKVVYEPVTGAVSAPVEFK